ncbi:transposase [Streptomyces sp. NPDC086182]|uniref:transposase n=1 Tax=Streptomyces sp. NPDC086182 TaxID=3155058 RepID=UPI00342DCBD9
MTGWITRHPTALSEEDKLHRKAVLDRCPELVTAAELTSSFAEMLTTLSGTRLPDRITEATDANLPGISAFAVSLQGDFDAVTAGLTTDWNSGPVEGTVNRIKMLKRQMFGRAGLPLLRLSECFPPGTTPASPPRPPSHFRQLCGRLTA